ncbi:MAG: response regulator, partial [Deltaproteobacteria bacterium]|nr:response regulator [Deltaproteobacteria bacterium]
TEEQLVAEVSALARLHQSSANLWRSRGLSAGLQEMLDAAIALLGADMGNVQILNPHKPVLEIIAQRGFQQDFLDFFREVSADAECACGRALREGRTILIEDIETEDSFAPYRQAAAAAGYRGVVSTPLVGRDGVPLGMLSTHFRHPHRPSEQGLRRLELYVRQCADFIDWIRTEQALRQSEERFRSLVSIIADVPWTMDADGAFTQPQPAWEAYTGQSQEEYCGFGWINGLHPDDRDGVKALWSTAHETQATHKFDGRLWHGRSGQWRYFSARATSLLNPDRTVREWVGAYTDIDDQKQAMEQLTATARDKDEFLAMLGHELRNPLASITMAAHVLGMVKSEDSTIIQSQEMIERQADHLARLVDDLLDVSRVQQGKVTLRKEAVDLQKAISRAVDACEHLITGQGHTINLDLQRIPPLHVEADPTRVDQVLVNLIGNASKYTSPNGTIHIKASRENGMAVIRVRDSGIGIEPDMLGRVFDAFTQVNQSLERSQGGLGLGLKLVKELVEMHGGSVEARSEGMNRGSEFIVRLPLLEKAVPRSIAEDAPVVRGRAGARRILVVDDRRDNREAMEVFLKLSGHRVEVAEDGLSAVEMALQTHPDVAFVDIGLPKLSGYDVAKKIRQGPTGDSIVLIAVSGYGQPEDKHKALDAGFDGHLTKPVNPDAISEILNELDRFHRKHS